MEPAFNLNPLNFDILYCDIDRDAGGEIMNIDIGDPSRIKKLKEKVEIKAKIFALAISAFESKEEKSLNEQ